MSLARILAVARAEAAILRRNRWVALTTAVMVLFALALSLAGSAPIGNWIAADAAVYVVGAGVAGGMGAPEIVPFADRAAADAFIARYGGRAVALAGIPDSAALGAVDMDAQLETPS